MSAVALWAWVGAVVLALVVLAYVGYELAWKARRLRRDLARLRDVGAGLGVLQTTLADARGRVTTIQDLRGPEPSRNPLLPDLDRTPR